MENERFCVHVFKASSNGNLLCTDGTLFWCITEMHLLTTDPLAVLKNFCKSMLWVAFIFLYKQYVSKTFLWNIEWNSEWAQTFYMEKCTSSLLLDFLKSTIFLNNNPFVASLTKREIFFLPEQIHDFRKTPTISYHHFLYKYITYAF